MEIERERRKREGREEDSEVGKRRGRRVKGRNQRGNITGGRRKTWTEKRKDENKNATHRQ